jgi:proteasome lid subunit RPN8/RPN11
LNVSLSPPALTPKPHKLQPRLVEYKPLVLDQILAHVTAAFHRFGRANVETAGVLFGSHSRLRISVLAMRPVTSGVGGTFRLDDKEFETLLSLHNSEPALAGLEPVGWFVSHSHNNTVLRPSDHEIFDRHFQKAWQLVLILRPDPSGSLSAATIARHENGSGPVLLDKFRIQQAEKAGQPGATEYVVDQSGEVLKIITLPAPKSAPREPIRPLPPAKPLKAKWFQFNPYVPRGPVRRWLLTIAAACLLTIVGWAANLFFQANYRNAIGLQAYERDGLLQIEWDTTSRTIRRATRATMEIVNGGVTSVKDLTRTDLQHGLFAVIAKGGDATARLQVFDASGNSRQELARYLGRLAADSERPGTQQLRDENNRLREALTLEQRRGAELQSGIRAPRKIQKPRRRRSHR